MIDDKQIEPKEADTRSRFVKIESMFACSSKVMGVTGTRESTSQMKKDYESTATDTNNAVFTTSCIEDGEPEMDDHNNVKESTNDSNNGASETDSSNSKRKNERIKKAGVAVAGGALITAGIPLIPVLCAGELMIIGGMALLATEFDGARNVLHKGREKLNQFASKDDERDESDDTNIHTKHESNHAVKTEDTMYKADHSVAVGENEDGTDKTVLSKFSKKFKQSMRKMVRNDILPMIDKFAPVQTAEEKSEKNE